MMQLVKFLPIIISLDWFNISGAANAIFRYPNNGKFTIGVNQVIIGNANVFIYNVLGAKVFDKQVRFNGTNTEINAQDLKAGTYLV